MKLHDRTRMVAIAQCDIELGILKIADANELTCGELMSILGRVLTNFAKYQIREERHGDASKKGDEA
jgi:hypothetical protein